MKTASMPALAAAAILLTPLAATAQGQVTSVAVHNCARALANRLHIPLGPVYSQPNTNPIISNSGMTRNEMVLDAKDYQGRQSTPMVCTYDEHGQVVSLRSVSPVEKFPNATISAWAGR